MLDRSTIGSLLKSECKKLQSQESPEIRNKFVHIFSLILMGGSQWNEARFLLQHYENQVHINNEGFSRSDIQPIVN